MNTRRIVAAALAAAAIAAAPATAPAATPDAPVAAIAKSCSAGYTHGVIGGSEKCLRRGQYCARAYKRKYRRYGFVCARDSRGVYRLR